MYGAHACLVPFFPLPIFTNRNLYDNLWRHIEAFNVYHGDVSYIRHARNLFLRIIKYTI